MRKSFIKLSSLILVMILILGVITALSFTASAESPVIEGDDSRLTVDKSTYEVGEPIMVSGVGSGKDWLGIYRQSAPHSIRWTYVDTANGGPGSGVAVNIRTVPDVNGGEPLDIPAGTYIIRLMPNDSTNISEAIAWTTITVSESTAPSAGVSAPISATYKLENDTDGFATGTVTVKMPMSETSGRSIVMYWADENGKLSGYTSLAKFKITSSTTEFTFGKNVIIPTGATRLLVYAMNDATGEMSESCAVIDLPAGAAQEPFGDSVADLFIMSDIHITLNKDHTHNKNFANMLKDVASLNKDAMGIFVVGDLADTGKEQEYLNMTELYNAAGKVPPLFMAIGNHDLSGLPFDEANAMFLKYATLPDGSHPTDTSYDFWLNGYHFIFLGTDSASGVSSTFERATMTWLRDKLDENRDPDRPVFLFLHQPLYETVSGSLPGENWHGVNNDKMLRNVLEDYPEVMFFNGHTHWTMDSVSNMFEGNEELPCRIFNCASVGYLWSGYDVITGVHLDGSQGYMIKLFDGKLYVLGRDFARGEWIPSAQYCVVLKEVEEETPTVEETTVPDEPVETPEETEAPTNTLDTDTTSEPANTTPDSSDEESTVNRETPGQNNGCGSSVSLSILLLLIPTVMLAYRRRKD